LARDFASLRDFMAARFDTFEQFEAARLELINEAIELEKRLEEINRSFSIRIPVTFAHEEPVPVKLDRSVR
jgi:hypothetical protein